MITWRTLFTALLCALLVKGAEIPAKFFGTYEYEKEQNLDNYLIARGHPWIIRKLVENSSATKIIGLDRSTGNYNLETRNWKKNVRYDFVLGVPFVADSVDGKKYTVTMSMIGDGLAENRVRLHHPEDNETYMYYIEGDYLTGRVEWNGVKAVRYYRRVARK